MQLTTQDEFNDREITRTLGLVRGNTIRARHQGKDMKDVANPLFFGYYTRFSQDEFMDYMAENMNDDQAARIHLARDIYQAGQVLRHKYGLLRCAYLLASLGIFMVLAAALVYLYAA